MKKLKVGIYILCIAGLGMISIYGYVISKINLAEIKRKIIETSELILPGSSLKIGNIEYSIGSALNLKLATFELTSKKSNEILLFIEEVRVRVPILSIIASGGNIDVFAKNSNLKMIRNQKVTNWMEILPELKEGAEKNKISFDIPSFIHRSKINLRFSHTKLLIKNESEDDLNINIPKFIVKNLNLIKPSAFEFESKLVIPIGVENSLNTNMQLVGEFSLKDILENHAFIIDSTYKLEDTVLSKNALEMPLIKGKIKLNAKNETLLASLSSTVGNFIDTNATISLNNLMTEITDIKMLINLSETINYFNKDKLKKVLNVGKESLILAGDIRVEKKSNKMVPNIEFKLSDSIDLNISPFPNINIGGKGTLNDQKLTILSESTFLNGKTNIQLNGEFDLNHFPLKITDLNLFNIEVKSQDHEFTKNDIQKIIYHKYQFRHDEMDEEKDFLFPKINMHLTANNILVNNSKFKMTTNIVSEKNKIKVNNAILEGISGKMVLNSEFIAKSNEDMKIKNKLELQNTDMSLFHPFYPSSLRNIRGIFNGLISGEHVYSTEHSFSYQLAIKAKNGSLEGYNIGTILVPTISKIDQLNDAISSNYKFLDDFESLELRSSLKSEGYNIKKLSIIGNKRATSINLFGNLFISEKDFSSLSGSVYIDEISKRLQTLIGKKSIDYKLSGPGLNISPDETYILNKISEQVLKKTKTKK